MYDGMHFELIAMTRPEGIMRRTIPGAERRAAMEPGLSLLLAEGCVRGRRHRLDRLRMC